MKELFIKCPSCGVVLGVKNSKNEAVKKITCPQCKQSMAVSFEVEVQPSTAAPQPLGALYYGEMRIPLQEGANNTQFPGCQCVALHVVRLSDGSSKCVVQPLVADASVKINGEVLQKDDKVVLAKGDRLEIGHVKLCYDKPFTLSAEEPRQEASETREEKAPVVPNSSTASTPAKSNTWLYALVGLMAFAIVVFLFWPKQKEAPQPKGKLSDTVTVVNEKKTVEPKDKKEEAKEPAKRENDTREKTAETPKQRTRYELEQAALHGDADAQLELGRELVNRRESHQVILGLNYLRQAARNGSSEAGRLWNQTVQALQQRAANDSAAYYILTVIDR